MENSYGIGIKNRYALFLDDESDPMETLSLKEQEKELKKKTKVAEKENKAKIEPPPKGKTTGPKKPVKDAPHKTQENKRDDSKPNHPRSNADGKPERNFNKFNNENREERNNRRNREDRPYNGPSENRDREDRPRRENLGENLENRNRDRGERGGRDGRALGAKPGAPRGPRRNFDERRGKREFDRQSGSDKTHGYRGVKPIDKRDGAGSHNWGSHKDVIEEADRPNNDNDQSWNDQEKHDGAPAETKDENEVETTVVEEEPKELTLDEWKAQREKRTNKPTYNIRKAGEGEDLTQWKKMYELRKKQEEQEGRESEDEDYDASAEYPQRVGRQKHLLDIDIQFNDSRRPGGGRGRGQRSGPRGGNRGNQRSGPGRTGDGQEKADKRYRDRDEQNDERTESRRAPKVDDERDFPSLG